MDPLKNAGTLGEVGEAIIFDESRKAGQRELESAEEKK